MESELSKYISVIPLAIKTHYRTWPLTSWGLSHFGVRSLAPLEKKKMTGENLILNKF